MTAMHFNEEDKQKFIEFLNMTAKHAKFEVNTGELINYFKLISHMQSRILPKIDANILEVKRVIEPEAPSEEDKKQKAKK